MIRVGISGAMGRMGLHLVKLVLDDPELELAAAIEGPDHPGQGKDVGIEHGMGETGIKVSTEIPEKLDVLIDFSTPHGTAKHLMICAAQHAAMVIGTTGIEELRPTIERAAETTAILVSPNMSVGVNLLFKAAADIARRLGPDYDIEIVEMHHRFKKDAPSGTALKIADEIAKATGRKLEDDACYGRHGKTAERKPGEIGVHAVRGGDVVGEHNVIYATLGEQIELKHSAHSRETFARGAIRAAKFLSNKPTGLYSMDDVLS